MKLEYICTFWGQEATPIKEFVKKAADSGYDGVELNVPFDNKFVDDLQEAVAQHKMKLIAQQWLPPANESVDGYRKRMKEYLLHLASLNPLFINSHTGKDFFSFEENCTIIEDTIAISKETGLKIIHETHRGRFAHHAYSLLPYLKKYPNLELNADFSHFCAVSESLLEDQVDTVNQIIPHCVYIHSRVGFDQAAQVNHPFVPEWQSTREHFLGWWQQIVDAAKSRNVETFYICPEFGPAPYMPAVPFTQQPVSSQWEINTQMRDYLKKSLAV